MNRDPKYFPDYDAFRPERFLGPDGALTDLVPDTHGLGHLTFGSGRRYVFASDPEMPSLTGCAWTQDVHREGAREPDAVHRLRVHVVGLRHSPALGPEWDPNRSIERRFRG